mgnify:CR=1 FL=1
MVCRLMYRGNKMKNLSPAFPLNQRFQLLLSLVITVVLLFFTLTPIQAQNQDDFIEVGGALRYNIYLTDFGGNLTTQDRQFTFDTWRLNVRGSQDDILIDFEYRFYPTFSTHFIHHGWVGYQFTGKTKLEVGVTRVPFGNLPYASHSWWFVTPYYVGLEDDHDIGFKLTYTTEKWDLAAAYFIQAEPNGPAGLEVNGTQLADNTARYSYDIVPVAGQSNEERNQYNLRAAYTFAHGSFGKSEVGLSGQFGHVYNSVRNELDNHLAGALHLDGNYGRFNTLLQVAYYDHEVKDDQDNPLDRVPMGAYGFGTYPVAAEAFMHTVAISYDQPVNFGPIDKITFYNDYTYTDKKLSRFVDTEQHTIGMSFGAGGLYIYMDISRGKNHPWLTDQFGTGLGEGALHPETNTPDRSVRWNTRYNINIGYYF